MATLTQAGHPPAIRSVRTPRTWPIRPVHIVATLVALGSVVAGMWVAHGGLERLSTPAELATGLGQVTALIGTYMALAQDVERRHRVLRDFLVDVLGVDAGEADETACRIEHEIPDGVRARIAALVEFAGRDAGDRSGWVARFRRFLRRRGVGS